MGILNVGKGEQIGLNDSGSVRNRFLVGGKGVTFGVTGRFVS